MSRLATVMQTVLVLLLATILALFAWSLITGRGSSHDQILRRLDAVERNQLVDTCMLSIPTDDRTPAARQTCETQANQLLEGTL